MDNYTKHSQILELFQFRSVVRPVCVAAAEKRRNVFNTRVEQHIIIFKLIAAFWWVYFHSWRARSAKNHKNFDNRIMIISFGLSIIGGASVHPNQLCVFSARQKKQRPKSQQLICWERAYVMLVMSIWLWWGWWECRKYIVDRISACQNLFASLACK